MIETADYSVCEPEMLDGIAGQDLAGETLDLYDLKSFHCYTRVTLGTVLHNSFSITFEESFCHCSCCLDLLSN